MTIGSPEEHGTSQPPPSSSDNHFETNSSIGQGAATAPAGGSSAPSGRRISRRVILGERIDPSRAHPGGVRHSTRTEYVAVPREVDIEERITAIPKQRLVEHIIPEWQEQTVIRQIPKETIVYHDRVTPVPQKRVIDEYVEEPFDDGTIVKYKPKIEVQEREIEVSVPRIVWNEQVEEVPEIREVVRYTDADDGVERIIRYMSDSPMNLTPKGFDTAEPDDSDSGDLTAIINSKSKYANLDSDTIVNVPVPFLVPKPICVPVDVPMVRFCDHFVPVPVRRHVKSALMFNKDVFDVPCIREKPVLIVSDEMKPVPVDIRIKVKEKDVRVTPIDPHELSQADHHAMWMRVGADQLEAFKAAHGGLYPRGMHVPENMKVPLKPTDWEACMDCDEDEDEEQQQQQQDGDVGDLGPLPLTLKHPLMLTYLQNKWMQTPTNLTHGLYTEQFVNAHATALNNVLNPECVAIDLTEEQHKVIGPIPEKAMPYPWGRRTYDSIRSAAVKEAERTQKAQHQMPEIQLLTPDLPSNNQHQVTESFIQPTS